MHVYMHILYTVAVNTSSNRNPIPVHLPFAGIICRFAMDGCPLGLGLLVEAI
jgi:hypothetical protein